MVYHAAATNFFSSVAGLALIVAGMAVAVMTLLVLLSAMSCTAGATWVIARRHARRSGEDNDASIRQASMRRRSTVARGDEEAGG